MLVLEWWDGRLLHAWSGDDTLLSEVRGEDGHRIDTGDTMVDHNSDTETLSPGT